MAESTQKKPVKTVKRVSTAKGSAKVKTAKTTSKPKSKGDVTLADEILLLTQSLDPSQQAILHRFSLRLQAKVALASSKWLAITCLVLALLFIIAVLIMKNSYEFIAVSDNGVLHSIESQSDINWTDGKIAGFSNEAVMDAFDFNFLNFNKRLERAGDKYFTSEGKASFEITMQPVVALVKKTKATLYAEGLGPGIIVKRDGNNSWVVKKEYQLTFIPVEGEIVSNKRTITTTVFRVDDFEGMKGLGVHQIVQTN